MNNVNIMKLCIRMISNDFQFEILSTSLQEAPSDFYKLQATLRKKLQDSLQLSKKFSHKIWSLLGTFAGSHSPKSIYTLQVLFAFLHLI